MEAIGLNPIRLDAIGIDPIRLNAIRLGVPGASSGSNRPYIDPDVLASLVAVCICDGKSNNDPDRAVIKNFIDSANPFVISNAAYKLNSGFGKYEEDFTTWRNSRHIEVEYSNDGSKLKIISENVKDWWLISPNDGISNSFRVKITNCRYPIIWRYTDDGNSYKDFLIDKDGIYDLPQSISNNEGVVNRCYFGSYTQNNDYTGLTIEQIPSFQGALVTDGVNDLITSTKSVQEMLGGSTELTVVTMMCNLTNNRATYNNQIRPYREGFIRNQFKNESGNKLSISGYTITNINYSASIYESNSKVINDILGDKDDYKNDITNGKLDGKFSVEGYTLNEGGAYECSQVACYWNFIAKKALTTDEINQVIAYYNLDKYVKPDIYYDVKRQGLSNNTPDADWYLKDFSGNGHDMQLYNYGKTPESGINEEGGLQSDGVTDYGKAENLPIYKDYTVVADREWASSDPRSMILASKTNGVDNGAFLFEDFEASAVNRAYSFGTATSVPIDKNRIISYQSKYLYNKTSIGIGTTLDGNVLCLCRGRDLYPFYANAAIWSFLLFPYTLSEFLLERQLKRYKLGTLYPDMVEFRPIIKSNVDIDKYLFINKTTNKQLNIGDYFAITDTIEIQIYLTDRERQEITNFTVNGKEFTPAFTDTSIRYLYNIENFGEATGKKSPQKIDITIDEYIRYEDIVQPYPYIVKIRNNDGYIYTYGDKLKVGSEIIRGKVINLLPELYSVANGIFLNGQQITNSEGTIIVSKNMVFSHGGNTYLKANEPNCIADPQRLSIPNSSYKILGYIPDISGHDNHLRFNNFAFTEESGVNEDGSIHFDGVEDFITIPTLSHGAKQVLMKVNWNSINTIAYDHRNNTGSNDRFAIYFSDVNGAIAYNARNNGQTYIDGILNTNIIASQLKDITHNITITNSNVTNTNSTSPRIGVSTSDTFYTKMALFAFMSFDEISSEDEIKELNDIVGIEGNTDDLFNEPNI